jgi:hypothetical protein
MKPLDININIDKEDFKKKLDIKDGKTPVAGVDFPMPKDGVDGIDGLDGKDGEKGDKGEDGSPDTPIEIREKLEVLEGDERLPIDAIRDLWPELNKIRQSSVSALGGSGSLQVLDSGAVIGSQVKSIDFVGAEVTGGDGAVTVTVDTPPAPGAPEGTFYVSSTQPVDGTRDGGFETPYADLSFMATEPTTQAEYDLQKTVIILDTETYTLPSTVAMGVWRIQLGGGFLQDAVGGTTWEIDSNLRFGSTFNPIFYVQKNNSVIETAWTGDGFSAVLKSGGTAVSILRTGIAGLLRSGNITIADGINAGASCASFPVFSTHRASMDASGTFRGRLTLVSPTQSSFNSTGDLEVGYFTRIESTTISALNVLEARSSTSTRTIRDLTLNTSGGVTWDSVSVRNWNVDAPSASEVLNKITSYPDQTINLLKVGAEAIGYDNTASGLTAEDVQAAIDELDTNIGGALTKAANLADLSSLSAAITNLGLNPGGTNDIWVEKAGDAMTGTLDMSSNDIDNVRQVINDGADETNPAFVTGDAGWWGTNAKTMYLSISNTTIAELNLFGYNILGNDAMFGDLDQTSSGMGVYFDQGDSKTYLGDWRNTVSETYLEIDTSTEYQKTHVGGEEVLDVRSTDVGVLKNFSIPSVDVNTATYTALGTEQLIRAIRTATGACDITLPEITSALDGRIIPIKDSGQDCETNALTILRSGSDTFEGSATSFLYTVNGESHGFRADFANNNWEVV